jgi:hypothetical protein
MDQILLEVSTMGDEVRVKVICGSLIAPDNLDPLKPQGQLPSIHHNSEKLFSGQAKTEGVYVT